MTQRAPAREHLSDEICTVGNKQQSSCSVSAGVKNALPPKSTTYHYNEPFDVDELVGSLRRLRPDVFVMQADVWWFTCCNYRIIANFLHPADIPWVLSYPIGLEPDNGYLPQSWIDLLKTVDLPITVSHFDYDMSQTTGVMPVYIPLGVDTKVFHPPQNNG